MKQILIEKYIKPNKVETTTVCKKYIVEMWLNEYWDEHSILGHPAVVWYYEEGKNIKIENKIWFKKGVRHREKKLPAIIFYENNEKESIQWIWKNGIEIGEKIFIVNEKQKHIF